MHMLALEGTCTLHTWHRIHRSPGATFQEQARAYEKILIGDIQQIKTCAPERDVIEREKYLVRRMSAFQECEIEMMLRSICEIHGIGPLARMRIREKELKEAKEYHLSSLLYLLIEYEVSGLRYGRSRARHSLLAIA